MTASPDQKKTTHMPWSSRDCSVAPGGNGIAEQPAAATEQTKAIARGTKRNGSWVRDTSRSMYPRGRRSPKLACASPSTKPAAEAVPMS
jgi:hypothetical protein